MNKRIASALGLVAIAFLVLWTGAAMAVVAPKKTEAQTLASKEFFKPELHISSSNVELEQTISTLSNKGAWFTFAAKYGQSQVYLDPRSGVATSVVTRIPMVPGPGDANAMTLTQVSNTLGRKVSVIDNQVVGELLRKFVVDNSAALGVDATQLGAAKAEKVTDSLWNVRIPQFVNGVPVRFAQLVAVINSGNLTLMGAETWGNARIDTRPQVAEADVMNIGFAFVGGRTVADEIWEKPSLEIVPIAPQETQSGEAFAGAIGTGYQHRLVWSFGFTRKGEDGEFEILIDAHTGEVLSFEDRALYETKKMTGGVYPLSDTEVCPSNDRCGQMQSDYPMPWADTGLAAPNDFSNSAGLFNYTSGSVTTHLAGKYVAIGDTCGAVAETNTGDLILGGLNGQHDCVTAGASAGDTASSRSAFYEINKLKEQARGWLPANTWLQAQLQTNVNLTQTCNAFYSPSAGNVNFYRSGGGCRNTGEIAAVFDHEWGHGLDDNDTGGALSNSSEIYADITAVLRLQASCVGYGFWWTLDNGCGMTADGTGFNGDESQTATHHCNLDCSGVRGADWDKHADHNPDTPSNFICTFCSSGSGPCGREVHCENAPGNQTAWDLANRDLEAAPFNMARNDAFIVANKVFYQGSGLIGNWETCTCPSTANGCGATNAYLQWLAADDDDGNLNNGTPHMTAIFSAFNRHGIACATPTVQNSGCAGGPTTAPNLSISVGSNSLNLSWTAVPGATSYRVLRSEGYAGCDFGKAVIAEVPGLTYTDPDVANGRVANYVVQAVGSSSACYGPGSACVSGTPQPCAGSISLTQDLYNCGGAPLNITVIDGDLVGAGTQSVAISSNTEHGPETLVLTETPANSGIFKGTFGTTTAAPVLGDGAISVSDGDSIAVDYLDVDYCGTPNTTVTKFAAVDCSVPIITNVQITNITGNAADVTFTTNEPTDAVAHYGTTPPPSGTTSNPALATSHTVHLSGLTGCTAWVVSVQATDPAGNSASDDNAGAYYGFITLANVTPTYAYSGPPVPIPDNTPAGASVTVSVPDTQQIVDLNVKVNLTHTYDGDLTLILIGPDNTTINLAALRGGSGHNYTDTVFDQQAATPIASGTSPFTGTFIPDQSLAVYNGQSAAGTWTFKVVDSAGVDVGNIVGVELQFTYPPAQCPTVGQVDLDKTAYQCNETVQIHVVDFSIVGAGTQPVTIVSTTEPAGETVVLNEVPANSGSFIGTIALTTAAASGGDSLLSITNGDTITVTYIDADDGYGGFNIPRTDSAAIDCVGPVISNTQASNIIADSADITFTTDTPGNTVVVYGTTAPPTTPISSAAFVTSHATHLTGLTPCTLYYYFVNSTDPVGNTTIDNNGGAYYTFPSDCAGPVITNVHITVITGSSVDVTFDTNEPGNTTVNYGTTTPPGNVVSSAPFVTSHLYHLTGLLPCSQYFFSVSSADPVANSTTNNNGGAYYTVTMPSNNNPSYAYSGPPVPIPDNNPTGATATVSVADIQQIQDLNVKVNLTHTYDGDLTLSLIGPDNTTVILSALHGGTGENYTDTVFDQEAATPIASGVPPYTGSFIPDQSLAAFNGKVATGTWTFKVVDSAGVDVGNIVGVELQFTFPAQPCGQPVVHHFSHTVANACAAGGPGDGDLVADPGETLTIPMQLRNTGTGTATGVVATLSSANPNVSFTVGSASYGTLTIGQTASGNQSFVVEVGASVACGTVIPIQIDTTANEGAWSDSFSITVGTTNPGQTSYPSTDTPKPIPDVRTPPVLSTIAVVNPGVVSDVNVVININHTFDADLDVFLIGPNGVRVELTTDNGSSGQNYVNTVFDDQAATSITTGTAPFTGSFKPEGLLSTLNGVVGTGNWTLEITDDANIDSGTLVSWAIVLTTPAGATCNACVLAAPAEATQLLFTAKDAVSWNAASGATYYHLYGGARSDLPNLLNGSVDSCERAATPNLFVGGLSENPSPSSLSWYLVRGGNSGGLGSAGSATAGPRSQDSSGVCP